MLYVQTQPDTDVMGEPLPLDSSIQYRRQDPSDPIFSGLVEVIRDETGELRERINVDSFDERYTAVPE